MWKLRMIKISKDLKKLLKIHYKANYEVGGIIFAKRKGIFLELETLSFKKGKNFYISFDEDDMQLFEKPIGNFIIGTWHSHPFQKEIKASIIDIEQWKSWEKKFIHIIYNEIEIKIFTSKGELIYVEKN